MTVENPNVKNTYGGNGVTTVFPFTFLLNAEDVNNVVVTLTNEHGQENATTDFTLSLNDKVVRYPKSGVQPLPHGWKITIQRQIPYTQTLNLTSQGPFFAEDIEAQLDRQEMQIQQLAEIVERTVRVSISSDIDPADLIAKIFQTGVDVSAQLLAAQQSASAAAGSEVNAKNSEAAAREMAERMNTVLASAADEIKQKLSAEYVPQTQGAEMRTAISNASIAILQRSRAYQVGDIAYHKALPSWARLECVRAGTTGATLPDKIKQAIENGGVMVTDGTVVWIIDDLRDGTPVGAVRGSLYLPAGYVKANGATVQRSDYPRLVALADRHNLWTDDVTANAGLFGRGDGAATMVLPNWTDRMVQLAGDGAGKSVAAGLPNIKSMQTRAEIQMPLVGSADPKKTYGKGGFMEVHPEDGYFSGGSGGSGNRINYGDVDFDASRVNPIYGASATVQPAAIKLIPIIRY